MRHRLAKILVGVALVGLGVTAHADTIYNEASSGDFSNNGLTPTLLSIGAGSNVVLGTTGDSGQGVDRDYFSFTVPTGYVLSSVTLLSNTTISGGSSFIGLQAGPQLTVAPTGAGAENLLGFAHYNSGQIGLDLMSLLAPGFPNGAPAGTYSAWVQELGGPVEYGFDFKVTPVPLPGAAILLVSGFLGAAAARRRKGRFGSPVS